MYFRLWYCALLWLVGLGLCGCLPSSEGQSDEQKNEYFIVGKERASARDYHGAIEAFEKAVEMNPRSRLAHFELGVLYEQHSNQKERDYVAAMYHYYQVIRLRPNEYPADNARQRIGACKQELVKAESLAPVAQGLIRELDRLKEENQNLRKHLEIVKAQLTNRPPVAPGLPNPNLSLPHGLLSPTNNRFNPVRSGPGAPGDGRVTPLPPVSGRTYTVKDRDTPYSIAKQYRISLNALLAANPNLNPKRLKAGQVLNIPSS